MKIIFASLCVVLTLAIHAQTTIKGTIKNVIPGTRLTVNVPFDGRPFDDKSVEASTAPDGSFTISVEVQHAQFVLFNYGATHLKIYVEPGVAIQLSFDAVDAKNTLTFKGSLAVENTFCKQSGLSFFELSPKTWNDSLTSPAQILRGIQNAQNQCLQALQRVQAKTSASFQQIAKAEIQYFAPAKLVELSFNNNAWTTRDTLANHYPLSDWRKAIAQAYDDNPYSDSSAVNSYNYMLAINNLPFFVQRRFDTREALVPLAEKIMSEPFDSIMKDLRAKGKTYWDYKVYNCYLTGRALQKALASFIAVQVHRGELEYVDEAYNDFIARFPNSVYSGYVKQSITPYLLAKAGDADETTFIADSSITLQRVIDANKGKVVFVDVWGTWCPACRDEMGSAPALEQRFKGKAVTFAYIAVEHNTNPERNWRQTVRFFNLAGTHILAGNAIKQQVEALYKDGMMYPSYILIDKNGNIANTNAERPSSGEALYKQIEALL